MNNEFCVFILTHGRPDRVKTYKTLKRQGYTGKIIIVCDDEDETIDEYKERFDDVEVFSKDEIAKTFDEGDLSEDRRTIVYARNACFEIAKKRGFDCFLELDDDYIDFQRRWPEDGKLKIESFKNIDEVFDAMIEFLYRSNAYTVAFAQGGDFIGGVSSKNFRKRVLRKAMNTFFCRTDKPFKFVGRINEDVNTYVTSGMRGELMMTVCDCMIVQTATQSNKGGMTETYLDNGTYTKSFFSVMMAPSCVKVSEMGDKHRRIHHRIKWDNCTPMIINERWKK